MLRVSGLTKAYGDKTILQDVSFNVPTGSITAFVGANGAGKTTVMKSILGFTPFKGEIYVDDEPVVFSKTNPAIGYLPDVPALYPFYTARQYLQFCQPQDQARVEELLERVGLAQTTQKIGTYSRGMRQRLGMAQALLHRPKLLICDEPTSALDPQGRADILQILADSKHETTIFFSTHILAEVAAISDRLLVLHNRSIAYEGALPQAHTTRYVVQFAEEVSLGQAFKAFMPVQKSDGWHVTVTDEAARADVLAKLLQHGYIPLRFEPVVPSLADFIAEVTT